MKNQNIKLIAFVAVCLGISQLAIAQTTSQKIGNNPTLKDASAVLELESSSKGFLLPRVALTSLNVAAPITAPADALTVFNTATAGSGVNAVMPGYYYWKKDLVIPANSKWVRLIDDPTTLTIEPWNVQNTSAKATLNTDPIYQNAKVAIGNFATGGVSTKQFEVKGDFKAEANAAGGIAYGTEISHPLNPSGAMHYWLSGPTNHSIPSACAAGAILQGISGSTTNTVNASDLQSVMSSQNGTNSLSTVRAVNNGNFFMETYNAANQYGATVSLQDDGLRLVHSTTGGTPATFLSNNNRTELLVQKTNGVGFDMRDADGVIKANYWFPTSTGTNGQVMTQTATGKMIWTNPAGLSLANNGLTKNTTTNEIELGGTLNRVTNIVMNNNTLSFTNPNQRTFIGSTGGLIQQGLNTSTLTDASIHISSPDKNGTNGRTNLYLQVFDGSSAQIFAGEDAKSLILGTHFTALPAPIVFNTTHTGGTGSTEKMRLTPNGELAIGATSAPSFTVGATTVQPKLHVAGDISTTGKIYTTNSVYADYVFEKYFQGNSEINPNYEFKSLNYVKDFIKTNHHLPGVESIDDLSKAENGYTFDMTKLTIQSLEKIEELYIHTIEQKDKIEAQQVEINLLKKNAKVTAERLERLEKLLVK